MWCDDGEWEQWEDLQSAPELVTLKENAKEKLDRAKSASSEDSKGKGKGASI